MGKSTPIAVAAGLLSLMAALPLLQGSMSGFLLFYVAGLPIYLAGFAFGATAGTLASLSGFIAATMMGGMLLASVYGLAHVFPAWTVVRQAMIQRQAPDGTLYWQPPGPILANLTAIAGGMLLVAAISTSGTGGGMSADIAEQMDRFLVTMAPNADAAARAEFVRQYVPLVPATMASIWVVVVAISAISAQSLLARFKKNMRPTPAYSQMELPDWLSWVLVASALVALVSTGEIRFVARNMALLMTLPFLFLGLAVVHQWARRRTHTVMKLTAVYLVVILSGWIGQLGLAAIGVLEQWAGLRKRLGKSPNTTKSDDSE